MLACARTDIHDVIRRQHGVLVMLHHDQRVAQIPQMLERRQQLVVVPLMEADAGLVKNVGHAHQAGSDLGRQTDALGLAAGERSRGAGKSQVIQPHVDQEFHPGPDLL